MVTIICPTCHRPEEVPLPEDLITIADAARLADRSMNTIMAHINSGHIRAYPTPKELISKATKKRPPTKMVSEAQIISLYQIETEKAS
jgi:hypothetical protein